MRVFMRIVRILGILLILGLGGFLIYHYFIADNEETNLIFEDLTISYDGQYHTIEVQNLTENMEVIYKVNSYYNVDLEYKDAGIYNYVAEVYVENKQVNELNAILEILPKEVIVTGHDLILDHGKYIGGDYEVSGLIEGEDLQGEIKWEKNHNSKFEYKNENYNVTFIPGKYMVTETLVNSLGDYREGWDELVYVSQSLFPVTFADTSLFENKTITSISFILGNYDEMFEIENYNFIIYIVDKELTRTKEECTIENGKKIVINIRENIANREQGVVTIENLNIKVGVGETLVFGDSDMQFSLCAYYETDEDMLIRSVFDNPLGSVYSLPLKIEGFWTVGGE